MFGFSLLGLIVLIGGYLVWAYNKLVSNKNLVEEGWSGIDVQLKRRADLIPNLIETVKGYASHEDKLFRDIAELRAKSISGGTVGEQSAVGQAMSAALGRLFAMAEAYPELKADANFRDLQDKLSHIEDEIQLSRRYYNGAVRNLNTMIESFPTNFVANQFQFRRRSSSRSAIPRHAKCRRSNSRHSLPCARLPSPSALLFALFSPASAEERITSFRERCHRQHGCLAHRARDDRHLRRAA
jgi:LemA protein